MKQYDRNILNQIKKGTIPKDIVHEKKVSLNFFGIDLKHLQYGGIKFENHTFKEGLEITNLHSDELDLQFINCQFHLTSSISDCKIKERKSRIEFTKCEFLAALLIKDNEISVIEATQSKFDNFNIERIKSDAIAISECSVVRSLDFINIESEELHVVNNNSGKINRCWLESPNIERVAVSSLHIPIKHLVLSNVKYVNIEGLYDAIFISSLNFDLIKIGNAFKNNRVDDVIRQNQISQLFFQDANFSGVLSINRTKINSLRFTELNSMSGGVRFNEVSIKNTLFYDCILSTFDWNQLEFVNPPEIIRCDLSTLKMSNVQWPKGKLLATSYLDRKIPLAYSLRKKSFENEETHFNDIEISDLRYQRDTYRQLKAASIANHNRIESLEFYKNEMILFWKEIRLVGGQAWYDRILVFVNRWVSNFGQSWHMPFLWLFFFHFVFYSSIISWNYFGNALNFSEEVGQYLYLINPAHRTPEYINTGWGQITEFFMRIFSGFFIFHFIKASRKFGKV